MKRSQKRRKKPLAIYYTVVLLVLLLLNLVLVPWMSERRSKRWITAPL